MSVNMMKDLINNTPSYYIAEPVKKMLEKGKALVLKKDWDRVFIVDGEEGSGKSLLALQLAKFLDPTFDIDRVTFNGDDFARAINNAQKGNAIILDEAFNGLASSAALSAMNKFLVKKLMECRQKNLFIILVLPTIFLLQKYASIFRSKALFHVYSLKDGTRGYYRVYNKKNKKTLYLSGAKMYSYSVPFISKSFRFYGIYPINEAAYRGKKLQTAIMDDKEVKIDKYEVRFAYLAKLLKENFKVTYKDLSTYLKQTEFSLNEDEIGVKVAKHCKNQGPRGTIIYNNIVGKKKNGKIIESNPIVNSGESEQTVSPSEIAEEKQTEIPFVNLNSH